MKLRLEVIDRGFAGEEIARGLKKEALLGLIMCRFIFHYLTVARSHPRRMT